MWQERLKAWVAALRARFAKNRPAVAEPSDDNGIDSASVARRTACAASCAPSAVASA